MSCARVFYLVLGLLLVLCANVNAKRFDTRCKLVRELIKVGIPNDLFLGQCCLSLLRYIHNNYGTLHYEWPDTHLAGFLRDALNTDIDTRVCLIEKVSNRDTKAFVVTPSGKKYYGLYQIPSRWCREGKRGGECNVACESLLDDDIRDDTACAVNIFHREGFKYWTTWTARCKNDDLITKEIYKCPDLNSPRSSPERSLSYKSDTLRARRRLARSGMEKSSRLAHFGIHWLV